MRKPIAQIGKRYGLLTVIAIAGVSKDGRTLFRCSCECGGERIASSCHIIKKPGRTGPRGFSSCKHSRSGLANITHGGHSSRMYVVWKSMVARCEDQKATGYRYYGQKGISICAEWRAFEGFRSWALDNGYADNLTIERVNPNLHYDPSNCEWISLSENTRRRNLPGHYWRSMTCNA
jgi:hypothetical protein